MTLPRRLADFAGDWRLERQVDDRLAGQVITAEGSARLTEDAAGGLIYDETVTLHLPNQAPITGTRRYLWRPAESAIEVFFEDGRFFHRIGLGQPAPEDAHDCPPDLYAGAYDFSGWPVWVARWRVRGPRKDYLMRSTYRRRG